MSTEQKSHVISFNGELYNYKELRSELIQRGEVFLTESDTEVVLRSYAHWGERCFERFRGMFALAIWDALNDRLILARDHFGKKPLYYAVVNGVLIFSSDLSSVTSSPILRRKRWMSIPFTSICDLDTSQVRIHLSLQSRSCRRDIICRCRRAIVRIERFFCPVYQDAQIYIERSERSTKASTHF